MNKILMILFTVLALHSCGSNGEYYSYLNEPDGDPEQVNIKYNMQETPMLFDHTIRAREIFIEWGDNTKPEEYILNDYDQIDSIRALKHTYASTGEYNITLRGLYITSLFLSRKNDNSISQLDIKHANKLRNLYCEGQPISELNISECPEIRILSCGSLEEELQLSGLEVPKKLAELRLTGHLQTENLDLSANDSLKVIYVKGSNISDVFLSELEKLTSIQIDSCTLLNDITIGNNPMLNKISLLDNSSLDARGLNILFSNLPDAEGDVRTITLRRNKGDYICDRSIATRKGWIFN